MDELKIYDNLYKEDYLRISDTDNERYAVFTCRDQGGSADVLINEVDAIEIINHLKERFNIK